MFCSGRIPVLDKLEVAIDNRVVGTTREPWTMGGPATTLRWLTASFRPARLGLIFPTARMQTGRVFKFWIPSRQGGRGCHGAPCRHVRSCCPYGWPWRADGE